MPDGATPAQPPASKAGLTGSAAEQRRHRLAKVEALRARGVDPYPVSYPRDHTPGRLREGFGSLEPGAETQDVVHVAGRVMLKRDHGGLVFMWLKDESGFVQIMASRAEMGDDGFGDVGAIDTGDWMGFEGRVGSAAAASCRCCAARAGCSASRRGSSRPRLWCRSWPRASSSPRAPGRAPCGALLLASAAGILYGAAAALTKSVMSYLDDGFVDVITSWEVYALIVVIALGLTVLEEDIRADGLEWALIAISALAMLVATAALARSQGEAIPQPEPEPVPAPA